MGKPKMVTYYFCQAHPWIHPEISCTPIPYPTPDGTSYLPYKATPWRGRKPNDYQSDHKLTKQFQDGVIMIINH